MKRNKKALEMVYTFQPRIPTHILPLATNTMLVTLVSLVPHYVLLFPVFGGSLNTEENIVRI